MLPVSPDLITAELEGAVKILERWVGALNAGLPSIDCPGSEQQLLVVVREMCGELRIVAGKCGNLAEVLTDD
jgi:hypothetical protein